jgi:hypothetical protein
VGPYCVGSSPWECADDMTVIVSGLVGMYNSTDRQISHNPPENEKIGRIAKW